MLQRQKMRRVKLRQLILLLLRTLIVLCVVFAFSRPVLKGIFSVGLSARARTSAVILLDNSFSMGIRSPAGILFDHAKERAMEIVDLLRDGDEAWLLFVSDIPVLKDHTQDFTGLRKMIEGAGVSNRATDIRAALVSAAELLKGSKNVNREVYLVTDMRRNGWQGFAQGAIAPFDERTTLFVLPVLSGKSENLSVDRVEFLDRLLEVGKPINLRAAVTNYSGRKRENVLLQLFVEGIRVGQTALDLEANRKGVADFVAVFDSPGQLSGYVEIEEDDLILDNRQYFTIHVPEEIRVLIVGGTETDAHYVRLALNPYEASHSFILPTVCSVDEFGRYALREFDVVLLTNVARFSDAQLSRLESYAEGGRGIVILLGKDIDPRFYNSKLLPTLFPATLGAPLGTLREKNSFLTFGTIDREHPIFKGLLSEKSTIESPEFYLVYDLKPASTVEPIISYSNGKVALAETRIGRGRSILFTTAVDRDWTNLMRKGIYVPLLYRVVQYLATDLAALEEYHLVGSTVQKDMGGIDLGHTVVCVEPDGEEQAVELKSSGIRFFVEYEHTEDPGIYRIRSEDEIEKSFAINVDPEESDLSLTEMSDVRNVLNTVAIHEIGPDEIVDEVVQRTRYGRELWKQFLLLAFILMCAEMLIARDSGEDRRVHTRR